MDAEYKMIQNNQPAKGESKVMRYLKMRIPILEWGPHYDKITAVGDLIAGVTLGLTLVPQSIAYAALAGLPVQYGLYSSFIGTILYVFFGTVKEVSIGPTSLMALLTLQSCKDLSIDHVVLLTFLSGCVVTFMGLLRLGFLLDLISPAVTSGFTSATAVIICVAQFKNLLGLKFTAESVIDNFMLISQHITEVRLADCLLSVACCLVLLTLRRIKDIPVQSASSKRGLWLLSISRNAIVVLVTTVIAFCIHDPNSPPTFKLSGKVEPGIPKFSLPPFSIQQGNVTIGFTDMVKDLGTSVILLPLVMVLANMAIAKAFSVGTPVKATQEMLTLGVCNTVGAMFHAMPTCGAFTRSAVSHSSGVRTPAAGLYSGIITLIALGFMTPYFYFIPRACLGSVLICAVMFMIDWQSFVQFWRSSKSELFVLSITFAMSVIWTVEIGVLVGMLANIAALLHATARPPVDIIKSSTYPYLRIRPSLCLVYLNIDNVTTKISSSAFKEAHNTHPIMLDMSRVMLMDHSAVEGLKSLVKKFNNTEHKIVIFNASSEVLRKLEGADWVDQRQLRASDPNTAICGNDIELMAVESENLVKSNESNEKFKEEKI